MPGTKYCKSCGGANPYHYMFLRAGIFLCRTTMNEKVASLLPEKKKPFTKQSSDVPRMDNIRSSTGQIAVCKRCSVHLLTDDDTRDTFLGYLPRIDHEQYRADAKKAKHLHEEGYLVLDRQDCKHCHLPPQQLLSVCHYSREKIGKLTNGDYLPTVKRSWLPFKDGWESTKEMADFYPAHKRRVAELMTRVIQPDIWYGRMAIANAYNLVKVGREVHFSKEPHFRIGAGTSVLYRGEGLDNDQQCHRDGDLGFNFVEPKTNNYALKVFPKSHHLRPWTKKNPPNVTGYGETLTLREGQICIFYSTLIHCGSASCQKLDNFSSLQNQLKNINKKQYEDIKWFQSETGKLALTDMSVHYNIERVGGERSEAVHTTGIVEVFRAKYEQRVRNKEGKAKSKEFMQAKHDGFKEYKYMTLPGKADPKKPCGVHIADVDESLNM